MYMNSTESFHLNSDVMNDLSNLCQDLVKYSYWKRCFIKQVRVSEWHMLLFVFIQN